jgi:hypothetical protein
MPALVTAFIVYFVLTRRWFWVAVVALILIGRLTVHSDQ